MTDVESDRDGLEVRLTAATTWEGESPSVWRDALRVARERDAASAARWTWRDVLRRPLPVRAIVGVGLATVIVGAVALSLPSLGRARSQVDLRSQAAMRNLAGAHQSYAAESTPNRRHPAVGSKLGAGSAIELEPDPARRGLGDDRRAAPLSKRAAPGRASGRADSFASSLLWDGQLSRNLSPYAPEATPQLPPDAPADRQVVRTATIDLNTEDVRGAFLKASHVISEAGGEFVQDSSLTGSGDSAQGTLTLRVRAERLGEVLGALRELGEVMSEQLRGEDVTAQVVDTEARLRNERRVEQELLELLDTRADADLKDVLELRRQIADVREGIERLDAHRESLSRLVSLATVLVNIRPVDKPASAAEPARSGLGQHFFKSFDDAWRAGVEALIDTGAWLVHVVVGGAPWWAALALTVLAVRHHLHQAAVLRGAV